ncbi:ras and EF-hand domain-containing protein isoform X1 [Polypterus senegalus]
MYVQMESYNNRSVRPDLRRLFAACDVNRSGAIEYEDFATVCRELSVPVSQVKLLFNKLDTDMDGIINYGDFSSRFHEVSESLDFASFDGTFHSSKSAWEEFEEKLGDDIQYLRRNSRGRLEALHELIHSTADYTLLQSYEALVTDLVRDDKAQCFEVEKLETSLRRTEEINAQQAADLEEEMQQHLLNLEQRVRREERQKFETVFSDLQKRHERQLTDLQAALDRLGKQVKQNSQTYSKEDVYKLKNQIHELEQEREQLKAYLLKAQTDISVLQAEMDQLKNDYTDQRIQYEREKDALLKMAQDQQTYSSQIEILQAVNKNLYDSNDGLRSALVTNIESAKKRTPSPRAQSPVNRLKASEQTPPHIKSYNSYADEDDASLDLYKSVNSKYSHVASWADKYLDSGVSVSHDTVDGQDSCSEYDSDHSQDSEETIHHSYSYAPSEIELSEVKSEGMADMESNHIFSRRSSISSSIRRRLPAFSQKKTNMEGLEDSNSPGPMYKLVLAGDAGSGKSSFLLRLCMNEFKGDTTSTLGVDFQMKKLSVDGEHTSLQIWDTAGQERFRSIARNYFRKAHGVLLMYDVTSEQSFLNIREWIDAIRESTDDPIPVIVIGNKTDLREELPESSCVHTTHGEKLAMAYGALFCETSAKEGTNVVEAVLHLAREVKKNVDLHHNVEPPMKLSNPERTNPLPNCCKL